MEPPERGRKLVGKKFPTSPPPRPLDDDKKEEHREEMLHKWEKNGPLIVQRNKMLIKQIKDLQQK